MPSAADIHGIKKMQKLRKYYSFGFKKHLHETHLKMPRKNYRKSFRILEGGNNLSTLAWLFSRRLDKRQVGKWTAKTDATDKDWDYTEGVYVVHVLHFVCGGIGVVHDLRYPDTIFYYKQNFQNI